MLIFLLVAALLSAIAISQAGQMRNHMFLKYNDSYTPADIENPAISYNMEQINTSYTSKDKDIINICGFVETWSIPIFFGLCIMLSSFLFYRNKLKKPIEILSLASKKIADNDLNFYIHHDSKDEMGQLCNSFEKMRAALDENNRQMWRSMEERKQLNATFSHDLRTPLTVLRGYTDFLNNYLPQGKVGEEKVMSTVSTMSAHILRLENYVHMMSETQRLEDTCISTAKVNVVYFIEQLRSTAEVLVQGQAFNITFVNTIVETELNVDADIVVRVFENMLSNAIRYVDRTISIRFEFVKEMLGITVSDDGKGFSDEDLEQATKPFYKSKTTSDGVHFGLGLHICKILSEKHGGSIGLTNSENGGASVAAMFLCTTTTTSNNFSIS
jgi:signal transduction histidine kinase